MANLKPLAHLRKKSPAWWLGLIVKFITAFYISELLQKFTESALWLPEELREVITFASSFTFLAFSELMAISVHRLQEGTNEVKNTSKSKKPAHAKEAIRTLWPSTIALVFLALFVFFFWNSSSLRSVSVWNFSPKPSWWEEQYGHDETNSPPAKREKTDRFHTPPFLNQSKELFYLPDQIDSQIVRDFLLKQGRGDLRAGIRKTLDEQPMYLIEYAETGGEAVRQRYSRKFIILHFCMILCIAGAWGSFQKEEEFALEALINFVSRSRS